MECRYAYNKVLTNIGKVKCDEYFGATKSCQELSMAADGAVLEWAMSSECEKCTANLVAQCEKVTDNLKKEFQDIVDNTNLLGSLFGNVNKLFTVEPGSKEAVKETLDSLWNVLTFLKDEVDRVKDEPAVSTTPAQPSGMST